MTLKKQIDTLKDNWLIIVLVVVLLGVFMYAPGAKIGELGGYSPPSYSKQYADYGYAEEAAYDSFYAGGARSSMSYSYYPTSGDFAPEVEDRMLKKTASISTEVERGSFSEAESELKGIATASEAFILYENVNNQGPEGFKYKVGRYNIKVESSKYDAVVSQLKAIGEIQSFNENMKDVTGTYTNIQTELDAEKTRMQRYQQMFEEAKEVGDKIELSDRIFNQERTIKYLEERIANLGNEVSYSTISVTISEEQSKYVDVAIVGLFDLAYVFVESFNVLLESIVGILPWAVAVLIIWIVVKKLRKKKR